MDQPDDFVRIMFRVTRYFLPGSSTSSSTQDSQSSGPSNNDSTIQPSRPNSALANFVRNTTSPDEPPRPSNIPQNQETTPTGIANGPRGPRTNSASTKRIIYYLLLPAALVSITLTIVALVKVRQTTSAVAVCVSAAVLSLLSLLLVTLKYFRDLTKEKAVAGQGGDAPLGTIDPSAVVVTTSQSVTGGRLTI